MTENVNVTEDDVGKRVVSGKGEDIGRVVQVDAGFLYVDPDPGLADKIRATLGWREKHEEGNYRLESNQIETITDDEIRLHI